MDWLKRNWVDLLMGGLILAVVGGFLTLLLRGGVFVGNTQNNAATPTPAITTIPAPTGTTTPETPTSSNTTAATPISTPEAPTQTTTPATAVQTTSTQPVVKPSTTPEKPTQKPAINAPNIPTAPEVNSSPQTTSSSAAITKPTKPVTATQNTQNPASKPENTTSSKPNAATNTSSNAGNYNRADFLRNYRVAAGSYTRRESADRAVAQLRARGLPSQAFSSGKNYVVVIGPYARENNARTALTKVRQVFPDAILYNPDGTRETAALKPSTTKPSTTKPSGGGSQPATLTAEIAYLQVGAFKDSRSAEPLLTKLRTAGFKTLLKNTSSGLLRVLVGPFSTPQIQDMQSELKTQGFTSFIVTL